MKTFTSLALLLVTLLPATAHAQLFGRGIFNGRGNSGVNSSINQNSVVRVRGRNNTVLVNQGAARGSVIGGGAFPAGIQGPAFIRGPAFVRGPEFVQTLPSYYTNAYSVQQLLARPSRLQQLNLLNNFTAPNVCAANVQVSAPETQYLTAAPIVAAPIVQQQQYTLPAQLTQPSYGCQGGGASYIMAPPEAVQLPAQIYQQPQQLVQAAQVQVEQPQYITMQQVQRVVERYQECAPQAIQVPALVQERCAPQAIRQEKVCAPQAVQLPARISQPYCAPQQLAARGGYCGPSRLMARAGHGHGKY